jgi:hypothetical protein
MLAGLLVEAGTEAERRQVVVARLAVDLVDVLASLVAIIISRDHPML